MTTPFDQSTRKQTAYFKEKSMYESGRNSAKESLAIALRALELVAHKHPECFCMDQCGIAGDAIAEIRQRGDYCLEGK